MPAVRIGALAAIAELASVAIVASAAAGEGMQARAGPYAATHSAVFVQLSIALPNLVAAMYVIDVQWSS